MRRFKALVLATTLLLAAAPEAFATFPGDNGLIVFQAQTDDGTQLFTMASDGSAVRQITHVDPEPDHTFPGASRPGWSPDGRTIVYSENDCHIAIIDADGTNRREVPREQAESAGGPICEQTPSFTPDGGSIVYVRFDGRTEDIRSVSIDGTDRKLVTDRCFAAVDVSPDGTRIACKGPTGLWVVDMDGTDPMQVSPVLPNITGVHWAPDGSVIAFNDDASDESPEAINVATVAPDGTGLRYLTDVEAGWHAYMQSYSPDGASIIYRLERGDEHALFIMAADGSDVRQLTEFSEFRPRAVGWGPAPGEPDVPGALNESSGMKASADPTLTARLPQPVAEEAPSPAPSRAAAAAGPFTIVRAFSWSDTGIGLPLGMDAGPDGLLYVLDTDPKVTVIDPADGHVVRRWGGQGAGPGQFDVRRGDDNAGNGDIAVAPDGRVYVADGSNHRVQVFELDGTFLSQFGSFGTGEGQFGSINELAIAQDGSVYVQDGPLSKFTPDGKFVWRTDDQGPRGGAESALFGFIVRSDGSIIGTCGGCGELLLLDPADGHVRERWPWTGEGDGFGQLSIDPAGNVYDWAYVPQAQVVFDPSGKLVAEVRPTQNVGLGRAIAWGDLWWPSPVFLPDGRAFAFGKDGVVELGVEFPATAAAASSITPGQTASSSATHELTASAPSQPSPAGELPEGRLIFGRFVADRGEELLHVLDGEASERMIGQQDECGTCATVSPAGDVLATLSPDAEGRFSVVLMRLDGSDRRELVLPSGYDGFISGPIHGSSVYLFGWDDDAPELGGIYRASAADFSGLTQLTSAEDHGFAYAIVAAPDGSRLLVFQPTTENGHVGHLLIVDADGSDMRRLNPEGTLVPRLPTTGDPASFSPDSKRVAFAAYRGPEGSGEDGAVFVADADSATVEPITAWGDGTAAPRWSPVGDLIAFERREAGAHALYLVDADGDDEWRLAAASDGDASAWAPVWSPSGEWLVFQRGESLRSDLWLIRPDGSDLRQLTSQPAGYGGVLWAP